MAGDEAFIESLAEGKMQVKVVTMLGNSGALTFTQDEQGLKIRLPSNHSGSMAWTFRIEESADRPHLRKRDHRDIPIGNAK